MKSINGKRGITLITLAVTIVVILILAGVTIDVTLGENGILNKSKEAANAMNNAVANDQKELDSLLNELNATMDSNWNGNIVIPDGNNEEGGGNTETGGENIGDLVENGTIEIGDYVAYNPTGSQSYVVNGTYSGTGIDQTINVENLNWRVLDKTEDGKVRLISENPTNAMVKLQGANGYNNAVYLLDELCNTLYKGTNATAKSLKIEDIQDKINLNVWDYHNYENYGSTFNPSNKQYPLIFEQEKSQTVNGRVGSLDLSEQTSVVIGTGTAKSWTVRYTYWNNVTGTLNYVVPVYDELFHLATTDQYWLSSRSVIVDRNTTAFNIRHVTYRLVHGLQLFDSNGDVINVTSHLRPVISLDYNVAIDTDVTGMDGKTPNSAWILRQTTENKIDK